MAIKTKRQFLNEEYKQLNAIADQQSLISSTRKIAIKTTIVLTSSLLTLFFMTTPFQTASAETVRTCLVLVDGYVSEYAWGKYQEGGAPPDHPGKEASARGLMDFPGRFGRWLEGWNVRRIDLEKHTGPLLLDGVDLVILDDVRQFVVDPHEMAIIEFVRRGGGLLVYGGFWGLGGCAKSEYSVNQVIGSFQKSPLGRILPVEITATPDWTLIKGKSTKPVFTDQKLGLDIDTKEWILSGLHTCKARGKVLAEVDGNPLICMGSHGKGTMVVYTGDDLAWVRAATMARMLPCAGTLWRRLAALAVNDQLDIPVRPDQMPAYSKPPSFAHPDQPMNFLWNGAPTGSKQDIVRDMTIHSVNLVIFMNHPLTGDEGISGFTEFGCPINNKVTESDSTTWRVGADGKPVKPAYLQPPCLNNPKGLAAMEEAMAAHATNSVKLSWIRYGHMGDETEFHDCFCDHCKAAFKKMFGYEMPLPKNDFSPEYLDQWLDCCLFKCCSVEKMYQRGTAAVRKQNSRLRMFASLPQCAAASFGDDQYHSQSAFDILWDHPYPHNMINHIGLNAALLEETAVLQGRPYVPVMALLQGFDQYDRFPRMPDPRYMREMVWQTISHGTDSVGWFAYFCAWWVMAGTEAWDEAGRMATRVLEPLTPTLYRMLNSPQPLALMYCYSQEDVDGLKSRVWEDSQPWKPVVRWYSHHATQDAYDMLKYAQLPFNVISELRLIEGKSLPWKAIIIPYVEHLHPKTRKALKAYMDAGGQVYVGADSTFNIAGLKKLPVAFDDMFTTWWPADRTDEWNQRRSRSFLISSRLAKAQTLRGVFADAFKGAAARSDDPETVYNWREAGEAKYLFVVNDHQIGPTDLDYRQKRSTANLNHFGLGPMDFPPADTTLHIRESGWLYTLLQKPSDPVKLRDNETLALPLRLEGGDGRVFLILPEKIRKVRQTAAPVRSKDGVAVETEVLTGKGRLKGSVPLRVDLRGGGVEQTVYATTADGVLSWTIPFLREFPEGKITVTITDLASGLTAEDRTR